MGRSKRKDLKTKVGNMVKEANYDFKSVIVGNIFIKQGTCTKLFSPLALMEVEIIEGVIQHPSPNQLRC